MQTDIEELSLLAGCFVQNSSLEKFLFMDMIHRFTKKSKRNFHGFLRHYRSLMERNRDSIPTNI